MLVSGLRHVKAGRFPPGSRYGSGGASAEYPFG